MLATTSLATLILTAELAIASPPSDAATNWTARYRGTLLRAAADRDRGAAAPFAVPAATTLPASSTLRSLLEPFAGRLAPPFVAAPRRFVALRRPLGKMLVGAAELRAPQPACERGDAPCARAVQRCRVVR